MKITLLLSGAATLCLFAGAPAMAEMLSTPSEQSQTQSLNRGAEGGTYASPGTLNGEGDAESNQASELRAAQNACHPINYGTGPSAPEYQRQPVTTMKYGQPDRDCEVDAIRHSNVNVNPDDFVALKTVDPDRLNGDSVEDASGVVIGSVYDVSLARDGTPSEVQIELNDGHDVRVSEAALRFNPADKILLTNLDPEQLQQASNQGGDEDQDQGAPNNHRYPSPPQVHGPYTGGPGGQ